MVGKLHSWTHFETGEHSLQNIDLYKGKYRRKKKFWVEIKQEFKYVEAWISYNEKNVYDERHISIDREKQIREVFWRLEQEFADLHPSQIMLKKEVSSCDFRKDSQERKLYISWSVVSVWNLLCVRILLHVDMSFVSNISCR